MKLNAQSPTIAGLLSDIFAQNVAIQFSDENDPNELGQFVCTKHIYSAREIVCWIIFLLLGTNEDFRAYYAHFGKSKRCENEADKQDCQPPPGKEGHKGPKNNDEGGRENKTTPNNETQSGLGNQNLNGTGVTRSGQIFSSYSANVATGRDYQKHLPSQELHSSPESNENDPNIIKNVNESGRKITVLPLSDFNLHLRDLIMQK